MTQNEDSRLFGIGWVLIPPSIVCRTDLTPTDKLLLGRINGLIDKRGYCWASNDWLGKQIGFKSHTISILLTKFVEKKLIRREVIRNDKKQIIERRLYPLFHSEHIPLYHENDIPLSSESTTPLSSESKESNRVISSNRVENNICPECEIILSYWNEKRGTKYKTGVGFQDNLKFWLQHYSLDDIKLAIDKIEFDNFWRDKMNPSIFFRQMNPRREKVDYIGQFLNMKQTNGFSDSERKKQFESEDLTKYDKYNQ